VPDREKLIEGARERERNIVEKGKKRTRRLLMREKLSGLRS